MRVLQLISSNGFYGAENVVMQLSTGLQQLGHEVLIGLFNAQRSPEHPIIAKAGEVGIEVMDLPCRGRFNWKTIRALRDALKARQIEVLHTHNYKSNMYGYLASRGTGVALVSTCHNWTDTTAALRFYGAADRKLLSRFDHVVAVSASAADRVRKAHLPPEKLSVIGNGVVIPAIPAAEVLSDIGENRDLVIGAVARLSPEKGVHILLQAAAKALQSSVRARFVIAGDGPERARLAAMARDLQIEERVEFRGFVPDVPALLQQFDIFIQPSLVDAMPMSVLEAMGSGLPVIASAIGAIPGLIEHGRSGLLVPAGDDAALARSIVTLCDDDILRRNLGIAARKYISQHCSAAAMARNYEQLYRNVRQPLADHALAARA